MAMMIFWLIVCIVMIAIELNTVAMISIWFAGGAGAALIAAMLGAGTKMQWMVFVLVSLVLLVVFRKKIAARFNKNVTPTNTDRMVGMKARVIEAINNTEDKGTVELNGQEWMARSIADSEIIEQGTNVIVDHMDGNKLFVKKA
ncbi:MAG: NfeD family protein [Eubacteriales bacterium]|nr:NfeD family protein [Eubacteriales bacterium]